MSELLERTHPVVDFIDRLGARLDALVDIPVWSMTPAEHKAVLTQLAQDQAKLDALRLRLLVEADRSRATSSKGHGTAAEWVAGESRQTRRECRSDLRLGRRLEKYVRLGAACAVGEVNLAQARVIVTALDRLPRTGEFAISVEQLGQAEQHLVAKAAEWDADKLAVLGWRIFEVIAPEVAEAWEGRKLEAQEARALRKTELRFWTDGQGICHGRFRIPELHGRMLKKFLGAFTNLDRPADTIADAGVVAPELPAETRNGLALMELIESITDPEVPRVGGCGATIVVTMTLEQLLGDLEAAGVCTLNDGGRISASGARRLACRAGIIPVVLGGTSQPLDLGRKKRFHNTAMRLAMGLRDGGRTAEDCDKPPSMTEAHHDHPWSKGGHTNLETGRLLCPPHHRRIHDPAFRAERLGDGRVRFHRRT